MLIIVLDFFILSLLKCDISFEPSYLSVGEIFRLDV